MNVLLIGSQGMVGSVISAYFREHGHNVSNYDDSPTNDIHYIAGSIHDTEKLTKLISEHEYDTVINCTAVINQDAENDKADAAYTNAYFPHFLEKITKSTPTVVVHRSTDCIFSGKRGKYGITDIPDATSFYARTKAVGELVNEKDITIRTSLIGPECDINGTGLFNWFMSQHGKINGFANAIWTGLTTIEFARVIEQLLLTRAHGLFQCVPANAISKYKLLCLFDKYFPGDRTVVRIENDLVDKSLIQSVGETNIQIPGYEEMISEMAIWIKAHGNTYKNY